MSNFCFVVFELLSRAYEEKDVIYTPTDFVTATIVTDDITLKNS